MTLLDEIARSLRAKAAELPDEAALELLVAADAVEAVVAYQVATRHPRSKQLEAERRLMGVGAWPS